MLSEPERLEQHISQNIRGLLAIAEAHLRDEYLEGHQQGLDEYYLGNSSYSVSL